MVELDVIGAATLDPIVRAPKTDEQDALRVYSCFTSVHPCHGNVVSSLRFSTGQIMKSNST